MGGPVYGILTGETTAGVRVPLLVDADGKAVVSGAGASTFTGLTDTPSAYTSKANNEVVVNPGATALTFVSNAFQTITSTTNLTAWDLDSGINAKMVQAENTTISNPTNAANYIGKTIKLRIEDSGSGSLTVAFGNAFKFGGGVAPIKSTVASSIDYYAFTVYSATEIVFEGSQHNIS